MSRLYANENVPLPVVEALRQRGHDVLTTRDAGLAGRAMPDEEVLAFAKGTDRAVVTLNRRHFIRLHADAADHAGVVVCHFDTDFENLAHRIDAALAEAPRPQGMLIRVRRGH